MDVTPSCYKFNEESSFLVLFCYEAKNLISKKKKPKPLYRIKIRNISKPTRE